MEWNQNQLKIAKLLGQGKKVTEIVKLGFGSATIYNVINYLKNHPKPALDDESIKNAPLPTTFKQNIKKKKTLVAAAGTEESASTPSGEPDEEGKTEELSDFVQTPSKAVYKEPNPQTADSQTEVVKTKPKLEALAPSLRFRGVAVEVTYTPVMMIARMAATEKWGWDQNIPFENFIDTILYLFFKDRGILLQAYVDTNEMPVEGNGHAPNMVESNEAVAA